MFEQDIYKDYQYHFYTEDIMYNCYTFTVQFASVARNICFTFKMNANLCDNFTQHGRDHWTKKCGRRGWGRGIYVHFSLRRQKRLAKTRAKPGYGALCSREACTPLSGPDKSFPVTLIVYSTLQTDQHISWSTKHMGLF